MQDVFCLPIRIFHHMLLGIKQFTDIMQKANCRYHKQSCLFQQWDKLWNKIPSNLRIVAIFRKRRLPIDQHNMNQLCKQRKACALYSRMTSPHQWSAFMILSFSGFVNGNPAFCFSNSASTCLSFFRRALAFLSAAENAEFPFALPASAFWSSKLRDMKRRGLKCSSKKRLVKSAIS